MRVNIAGSGLPQEGVANWNDLLASTFDHDPEVPPVSSLTDEIPSELRHRADDLDRRAIAAQDANGVYLEAQASVRQAARLIVRAACAGLLGDPRTVVERIAATDQPIHPLGANDLKSVEDASTKMQDGDFEAADAMLAKAGLLRKRTDPTDKFVAMLLRAGRAEELGREPTLDDLRVRGELTGTAIARLSAVTPHHDPLLITWVVVICPYLRAARPGDFTPDPGKYDCPELPDEARWRLNEQRGTGMIDWNAASACRVAHSLLGPVGAYTSPKELTHARAQARVWAEAMRAAANLILDGAKPIETEGTGQFTAAEDYSWVRWPSGRMFTFTQAMRPVVKLLCDNHRKGIPTSKTAILDTTGRHKATAVRDIFKMRGGKMTEAWGTMIVRLPPSMDVYRICDPGPTHKRHTEHKKTRQSPKTLTQRKKPARSPKKSPK